MGRVGKLDVRIANISGYTQVGSKTLEVRDEEGVEVGRQGVRWAVGGVRWWAWGKWCGGRWVVNSGLSWRPEAGFGGLEMLVRALEVVGCQTHGLAEVLSSADDVCVVDVCVNLDVGVELLEVCFQVAQVLLSPFGVCVGGQGAALAHSLVGGDGGESAVREL